MKSSTPTFNQNRVNAVINFIEKLKITIGQDSGKPFVLRPWQKKFISDVYGPVRPDGRRMVRRAIDSLPRKNGKSEIIAALVLVHLIGPESEQNGEIYSAANDRMQASIVFNAVKRFIEASPVLKNYLRVVDSTKTIFVTRSDTRAKGSRYRALSADAGRQHGLNPSVVVVDELAQAKSRELFDTLATSQGARSEPLLIVISTQSHDPQHVLSEMIDDALKGEDPTIVCHLYQADEGCDVLDEEQWFKANPALGDFLDLDGFRADAARAARLPSEEQAFRLLRLNQRVAGDASLITSADWKACTVSDARPCEFCVGERVYLALDMAVTTDLCALVAVSADNGSRVKAWFFKPADSIEEHSRRDRFRYDLEVANGTIITTPGRAVDPKAIALKIAELCGGELDVVGLAYDRYRIDTLLRELDNIGFEAQQGPGAGLRLEPWGQGFKDMGPAVDAFELAVVNGELVHPNNKVLTWNVMNAQVTMDPAGNRKLDKAKARFRIDGAVALAMAMGLRAMDRASKPPENPWSTDGWSLNSWN